VWTPTCNILHPQTVAHTGLWLHNFQFFRPFPSGSFDTFSDLASTPPLSVHAASQRRRRLSASPLSVASQRRLSASPPLSVSSPRQPLWDANRVMFQLGSSWAAMTLSVLSASSPPLSASSLSLIAQVSNDSPFAKKLHRYPSCLFSARSRHRTILLTHHLGALAAFAQVFQSFRKRRRRSRHVYFTIFPPAYILKPMRRH
jgi:hypothetical protein